MGLRMISPCMQPSSAGIVYLETWLRPQLLEARPIVLGWLRSSEIICSSSVLLVAFAEGSDTQAAGRSFRDELRC